MKYLEGYKFYVYKTTNLLNGKIYVGVHKSKDIFSDKYIGSGYALKQAIDKYGYNNFRRDIIACFDQYEKAFELEEIIVDKDFINRKDVYNLVVGGKGFYFEKKEDHPMYGKNLSKDHKRFLSDLRKQDWKNPEYKDNMISKRRTFCSTPEGLESVTKAAHALWENPESVSKMKETRRKLYKTEEYKERASKAAKKREHEYGNGFKGKSHTEDSRKRMSESKKELWANTQHPMVGRKHSEESKNKMRKSRNNLPDMTCPHCDKTGKPAGMRRWHFNNCKALKE